jgi:hypothetical protein
LAAFVEGQIVYHNIFEPSPKLKGITPAKALEVKLPKAPSGWMLLSRLLTS